MGIFDWFRSSAPEPVEAGGAVAAPQVRAFDAGADFYDMNDPYLAQFLRGGNLTASGAAVSVEAALKNTAVFRSVSLLSYSIGMLPLHLYRQGDEKEKAAEHPLFRVLYRKPNGWQTAYEFRQLMQAWALVHGNAYAMKIMRGDKVIGLAPIDPARMEVKQADDFSLSYRYQKPNGEQRDLSAREVFHLRGFTLDGLTGRSMVRQAAEAIGLALQAERAAARLFRNGMMVGGALKHPEKLSPEALDRLRASMEAREGASNAHKWLVLEEGMEAETFGQNAKDSQHLEMRAHQIEEIGRIFGVPRPLLGVDDTSWGSGIDVLGQMFVRYGLNPWIEAWQQAISRDLLSDGDQERFYAKFNVGALLRGNMKDMAEFFAKGLGSGGHHPFLHPEEARDWLELGQRDDLPEAVSKAKESGNDAPQRT